MKVKFIGTECIQYGKVMGAVEAGKMQLENHTSSITESGRNTANFFLTINRVEVFPVFHYICTTKKSDFVPSGLALAFT